METENTSKPIASILPQIVATLVPSAEPTMEQQEKNSLKNRKRGDWLATALKMKLNHHQLKAAIPSLADLVFDFMNPKLSGGVVIIFGKNGCGKTHIAKAIRRIFEANRFKIGPAFCEATTESESELKIVDCCNIHWPSAVEGIKKDQWFIFEQAQVEYLTILDDIGAEHDPSGIGLEKLYLILNRRERKHTLITTNYPPEQWESKFERRVASRLYRNATHINLSAVPDYNT